MDSVRAGMQPEDVWSYRSGRQILDERELLGELPQLAAACRERPKTNDGDASEQFQSLGWAVDVPFEHTCPEITDQYDERETFTAYKDGILVEHDTTNRQKSGNWHLLKLEAAYRDPRGFPGNEHVDAAVVLLPATAGASALEQVEADVNTRLANHFDFSIPLLVWQYPQGDSAKDHDAE